jgi:hypothetical protein
MKEMFKELKNAYTEDPKEFWEVLLSMVLIFGFMIFIYWFAATFCYDM